MKKRLFFISPDEDLLFEVETSRVNFLVSFNSDDQRNTDKRSSSGEMKKRLFFISPDEDLLFEVETSRVNFLVSFNSDDQRNTDVATTADVTTYKSKSSR